MLDCQAAFVGTIFLKIWANGQRVAYKMTTQVRLFALTSRNVFSLLSFKKYPVILFWLFASFAVVIFGAILFIYLFLCDWKFFWYGLVVFLFGSGYSAACFWFVFF